MTGTLDRRKTHHLAAIAVRNETGLPNLYPWRPKRYLEEMRSPDFGVFRRMRGAAAQEIETGT